MTDFTIMLTEYQEFLIGNRADIRFNAYKTPEEKQEVGAALIRYGIEHLLQWTPQQVIDYMTPYIAEKLKWNRLFTKGLIMNDGIAQYHTQQKGVEVDLSLINWSHLMSICYPKVINFSQEVEAIKEYHRIINAKDLKEKGAAVRYAKFANNFIENSGTHREAITAGIFRTFIHEFVVPEMEHTDKGDVHDLFKAFSDTAWINKLFKRAGLYELFNDQFDMPYDMLDRHFYSIFGFYAEDNPDAQFWRRVYGLRAVRILKTLSSAKLKSEDDDDIEADDAE